ncbi:hypothetical protein [Demequina sp. NBRC 110054]|uniref:hypothetical protein n=1 Tax=Demequina sp. NBRC 110054 TaxID=1570343 RepID=UPI0009FC0DF1|nr:hypothetical protein [Demequina sp. NBRC 110054]
MDPWYAHLDRRDGHLHAQALPNPMWAYEFAKVDRAKRRHCGDAKHALAAAIEAAATETDAISGWHVRQAKPTGRDAAGI